MAPKAKGRCAPPAVTALAPELAARRDAALLELARGRYVDASDHFARVLEERPNDLGAYALRVAADAMAAKARARALDISVRSPVVVDGSLHGRELTRALEVRPGPTAKLHEVSKTRARFGPFTDWFLQHGIQSPEQLDPHDLGASSTLMGLPIAKTFRFPDHRVDVFGTQVLAAVDPSGASAAVFDFRQMLAKAAGGPPYLNYGVIYGRVVGKALLVEICAMGVESTAATPNAFLVAVDLDTGRFLWETEMRVAGAQSFIVSNNAVIAAAGMTGKPGRVTVVDTSTGKLLDELPIPFAPVYVVSEKREILVQGGDQGEATFTLDDDLGAPQAASLPPVKLDDLAQPASEDAICELRRALVAVDARDGAAAASALGGLSEKDPAANALRGVSDFLVRAKEHPEAAFDLTSTVPIELKLGDAPKPAREALQPAPVVKRALGSARPLTPRPLRDDAVDDIPQLSASDESVVPATPGFTFALPDALGNATLSGSSAWPSGNLIYYGPKYIVTLRGASIEHVFDISALLREGVSARAALHLGHMELAGERLLLSFTHRGPASELGGDKDYVLAFDRKSGALLWRSDPLVSSMRFSVRGDYAFTAWGGGSDPGALFVLRVDTGETVAKIAVTPAPYELGWDGSDLVLEADSGALRYSVR